MSTPLNQFTVEQVHKEYNSLVDKIVAKYQQLDSSEFGAVGTPGFNTKSTKLASVFACMSQLCQKTEPANGHTTSQAAILQALKSTFSDQNIVSGSFRVWRMQLCSYTSVRITGLLSTFSF